VGPDPFKEVGDWDIYSARGGSHTLTTSAREVVKRSRKPECSMKPSGDWRRLWDSDILDSF